MTPATAPGGAGGPARGSLTVEAALVVPVLLVVLAAIVEVVSLASTHLALVAAAREGARVAAVDPEPSRAVETVREALSGSPGVVVSVERDDVVGGVAAVVVTLEKPLVTPLLEAVTVPLRARATMRVEL